MSNASSTLIPAVTLGWRIRMALEHADIKVNVMADEIGVARTTLGRWMHDGGAPPRDGFVKLIALRTGVPYEWIKYGVEDPETGPDLRSKHSTCTDAKVYELARRSADPAIERAA